MRVLSLFDGLAGGRLAMDAAGLECEEYLGVEIDPHARAIADHTYNIARPTHDIYDIAAAKNLGDIDLMLGGFPCQDFSAAGLRKGMAGARGVLYEDMLRWRDIVKPKHWVFENVVPRKSIGDILSSDIGVPYIAANSMNYGAQHRERAFWSSHHFKPITTPSEVVIDDILGDQFKREYIYHSVVPTGKHVVVVGVKGFHRDDHIKQGHRYFTLWNSGAVVRSPQPHLVFDRAGKMSTIRCRNDHLVPTRSRSDQFCRVTTIAECAKFQNIPPEYILHPMKAKKVTETKAVVAVGNAFDISVVAHILRQVIGGQRSARFGLAVRLL